MTIEREEGESLTIHQPGAEPGERDPAPPPPGGGSEGPHGGEDPDDVELERAP